MEFRSYDPFLFVGFNTHKQLGTLGHHECQLRNSIFVVYSMFVHPTAPRGIRARCARNGGCRCRFVGDALQASLLSSLKSSIQGVSYDVRKLLANTEDANTRYKYSLFEIQRRRSQVQYKYKHQSS
eukprot:Gregarina_sp_Poly_1__1640@NODE_1419_length_4189_cov_22_343523_g944_i1_p2_GENE_NODE_1419_length_4189_cov_22_343523_g944_i1NODE_1419_length_4189_cov_22_343523_g944_i1_p2_ORF_typecomplete_len126_score2_81Lip_prot_lig_C/PF10437_9/0_23_NODE_1419_length_4189_cov_22_343523_g944_i1437814